MSEKELCINGVPVERQEEASTINSQIHDVSSYIAEELVKIWEIFPPKDGGYYCKIRGYKIYFMLGHCGEEKADWLFNDEKSKWIKSEVKLTREDVANPTAFLSKHKEYRQKCDEYKIRLQAKREEKTKEKRREEFEKLKEEFETS